MGRTLAKQNAFTRKMKNAPRRVNTERQTKQQNMNTLAEDKGTDKESLSVDERNGLPSASGLERIALCPGSWRLESQCPRDEGGEDAASGTRIHAWLAGEQVELSEDEASIAEKCREQASSLIAAGSTKSIEQRLWYADKSGSRLYSGQADIIARIGDSALIVDYKTGRGAVAASPENIQLRALAVLVKHNFPDVQHVAVAIIQPLARKEPVVCEYGPEELKEAEKQILAILEAAKNEDAELVPSEAACKYCRAKTICPALRESLTVPVVAANGDAKEVMQASAKAITGADLGNLIATKVPLARMLCDALEKEAFARLVANPDSVPGLSLDTETPRVSDSVKLWERSWLAANDKLTPAGRAKSGAGAEAKTASELAFSGMIETKLIERRSWTDKNKASETLQAALSPEQYREVAGKIVVIK